MAYDRGITKHITKEESLYYVLSRRHCFHQTYNTLKISKGRKANTDLKAELYLTHKKS